MDSWRVAHGTFARWVASKVQCSLVVKRMNRKRKKRIRPVHPGEILREDFLKPLGLSVNKLALALHVLATRIAEIVHGRRRVTADTALRLARYFNTNAEFWLNLQNFYELEISRRSEAGAKIDVQVQPWERDRRAASGAAEIEETADSSLRSE
jgi:addiction module HigA family antidote